MTRIRKICLVSLLLLLASCGGVRTTGIGKVYSAPQTPECVTDVEGFGFYDYRFCKVEEIGPAWVEENSIREKYEKQIAILNEEK